MFTSRKKVGEVIIDGFAVSIESAYEDEGSGGGSPEEPSLVLAIEGYWDALASGPLLLKQLQQARGVGSVGVDVECV